MANFSLFCLVIPRPTGSSLVPYTTLFRSRRGGGDRRHPGPHPRQRAQPRRDRKSTRLNFSHSFSSYGVVCLKKEKKERLNGELHVVILTGLGSEPPIS